MLPLKTSMHILEQFHCHATPGAILFKSVILSMYFHGRLSVEALEYMQSTHSAVCQLGQCSDIRGTSVFQVWTSLIGINRLWWGTQVMWTPFFTFWIIGCVSEMAQKWPILGQNHHFWPLVATEAPDGWQKWIKWWIIVEDMGGYPRCKTRRKNAPSGVEMAQNLSIWGQK